MLTEKQVAEKLEKARQSSESGVKADGSLVRVVYHRTGKVTEKAMREAQPALEAGQKMDEYVGTLDKVARNKDGELYFTLHVANRIAETPNEHQPKFGNFRTFNTVKGEIESLEVLS